MQTLSLAAVGALLPPLAYIIVSPLNRKYAHSLEKLLAAGFPLQTRSSWQNDHHFYITLPPSDILFYELLFQGPNLATTWLDDVAKVLQLGAKDYLLEANKN